jgi:hypothetical protein
LGGDPRDPRGKEKDEGKFKENSLRRSIDEIIYCLKMLSEER